MHMHVHGASIKLFIYFFLYYISILFIYAFVFTTTYYVQIKQRWFTTLTKIGHPTRKIGHLTFNIDQSKGRFNAMPLGHEGSAWRKSTKQCLAGETSHQFSCYSSVLKVINELNCLSTTQAREKLVFVSLLANELK